MKKETMKKAVKPALVVAAAAGISVFACKGISEYFYDVAIRRKRKEALRNDETYGEEQAAKKTIQKAREWFALMPSEEVVLHSFDNTRISAKLLKQNEPTERWVIVVHGYGSNYKDMLDVAQAFYQQGYNLLLPNNRGHGLSSGKYIGMGWHDRLDVLCWINYLTVVDEHCKIILHGTSMGASTVMNVTGEILPENVICCIEDCGYSSTEAILDYQLKQMYPSIPSVMAKGLLALLSGLTKKRCHYSLTSGNCLAQLEKSQTPTLFIHGEEDQIVPFNMVFDCYYACSAPKELYTIPQTQHAQCSLQPNYYDRVFRFIERCIQEKEYK